MKAAVPDDISVDMSVTPVKSRDSVPPVPPLTGGAPPPNVPPNTVLRDTGETIETVGESEGEGEGEITPPTPPKEDSVYTAPSALRTSVCSDATC